MTAKEKAKELVEKFLNYANDEYHECAYQHELNKAKKSNAKQCAKIAVEEILNILLEFSSLNTVDYKYWNEVLKEIDNL